MLLFVTVGSTSFDDLILTTCSDSFFNFLASKGFTEIIFQIGSGKVIPEEKSVFKMSWFRFKEDIEDDIKKASLIISHGGSGTILEALFENKPLIVVLNEKLMDNHQSELSEKLAAENYLKYTTCFELMKTLQEYLKTNFSRTTYEQPGDKFYSILHYILGLK